MMQFKFPNVLLLHSTSILTFLCTRTIVKKNIHAAVTTLRKRVGKKWKGKKMEEEKKSRKFKWSKKIRD